MVTRKVDDKGRIFLPEESLDRFTDHFAYFDYNPDNMEVYVFGINQMQEIKKEIELNYGPLNSGNIRARNAARQIGSRIHSGYVQLDENTQSRGRIVIPESARRDCGIKPHDDLEILIQDDKIVLKKLQP